MAGKYERIERYVHRSVNRKRSKNGLQDLQGHEVLINAARSHARHMAQNGYFSHYSKEKDQGPADRAPAARGVGENIAQQADNGRHPKTIGRKVAGMWMDSQGHRENILRSSFTFSGVGVWKRGQTVYVVQMYANNIRALSGGTDHIGNVVNLLKSPLPL